MIFSKKIRILSILFGLLVLTSSCEDKKYNDFGSISLSFDYAKEVEATATSQEKQSESPDNQYLDIPKKLNLSLMKEYDDLDKRIKDIHIIESVDGSNIHNKKK